MSELTLLQRAMRVVEEHEPGLFDVHTNKGRDFIRAMSELLNVEREQMKGPQCKEGTGTTVIYNPATGKTYTPQNHDSHINL
jgi:hypothetical protein